MRSAFRKYTLARFGAVLLIASLASLALAQQSGGSFGGGFGSPPPPAQGNPGGGGDIFTVLPYLFYGGGGSAGLLIVALVVLVPLVTRWLRQNSANRGGALGALSGSSAALKVQLMLLEGEEVKSALRRVALEGDTNSASGLASMVQESVLTVLRHPERWVYGTVEVAGGSDAQSGQRVASWATAARAAYGVETTRNQGKAAQQAFQGAASGTYCVVTFAVAARDMLLPHVTPPVETAEVRSALEAVAGVTAGGLVAAQVVWTPDAPGEFMTEDVALRLYPTLYRL